MFESRRKLRRPPRSCLGLLAALLVWVATVTASARVQAKATLAEGPPPPTPTANRSQEACGGPSAELLGSWQHKLDAVADVLGRVDDSVQDLQEKAHTWAIFHHHIDAWNEQMQALEHKVDLLKRTQDEHQAVAHKLTSLEFTLNHVLSKVVLLSDGCQQQPALSASPAPAPAPKAAEPGPVVVVELLRELQRSAAADRRARGELMARLSNVLHRLQRAEADRPGPQRSARLMQPVGGCNATQRLQHELDRTLRAMDQKLAGALAALSGLAGAPKDLKQLLPLAKKNARGLEAVAAAVAGTEEALARWRDAEANQTSGLHAYCAAVAGELSTFTESSDLLLKRIERVVGGVSEKLARLGCDGGRGPRGGRDEGAQDEAAAQAEEEQEEQEEEEEAGDSSERATESVESFDVEQATHDQGDDEEEEEEEEQIDFVQPLKLGCHELPVAGRRVDGIYRFSGPELNEAGRDFNERLCAFATEGAAWTVIQNRGPYREQENFNRSWAEYRAGFGRLDKDFWFGTEHIHQLVYRDDYELRVELEDFEGVRVWAEYAIFRVDGERFNYNLLIGGFRGAVPDAMRYHNERDFSTYDRRNDRSVDACCACATGYASGWWFDNCSEANLNGVYRDTPLGHNYVGVIWEPWRGDYSLRQARMLVRPKDWAASPPAHEPFGEFAEDP